jgi:hypothetical protein
LCRAATKDVGSFYDLVVAQNIGLAGREVICTVFDISFSINFLRLNLREQSTNRCCVFLSFLFVKRKKKEEYAHKNLCFIIPAKKPFSKVVSVLNRGADLFSFLFHPFICIFSSLSVFFIFLVPKDYTLHDHSKGLVKLWKEKITITSTVWVEGRHK